MLFALAFTENFTTKFSRALALALTLSSLSPAHGDGDDGASAIQRYVLDNGMQVYFIEDRRNPAVMVQVWYRVGSADEPVGQTGISHLLEHMLFWHKGNYTTDYYIGRIEAMGGRYNAFTSYDYTGYYAQVASTHLEEVVQMEAERMRALEFDLEQFEKERRVVMEERHLRVNNKPLSQLYEQLLINTFERSAQRNPLIGWNVDIESITAKQLKAWHRRWYQPDNTYLIVVGDSDFATIKALARKYFGRLDNLDPDDEATPLNLRLSEPAQIADKRVTLHAETDSERLILVWKIPTMDREMFDPDTNREAGAFDVYCEILGLQGSGLLTNAIIDRAGLASNLSVSCLTYTRGYGRMMINATAGAGVELETLERAIITELENLRIEDISPQLLQRVKTDLVVGTVYLRDSPFYQAYILGSLIAGGSVWQMWDLYPDWIEKIDRDAVMAVAKKYIVDQAYSGGYLRSNTVDTPTGSEQP